MNFTIKEPCIIDISHWNADDFAIDWEKLDSRIVGVIIKATQFVDYRDPTAKHSYEMAGKQKRPRGLYHYFDPNRVEEQVENFLSFCIEIGAFDGTRWLAEIEPVLDAEYFPNAQSSVVGTKLADQYKLFMDLVEKRTGVRPTLYTSKWCMDFTRSNLLWTKYTDKNGEIKYGWFGTTSSKYPNWIGEYKHWVADYINSNSQTTPDDIIGNVRPFIWQYSKELLGGFSAPVDANQFVGTLSEWKEMYYKNIGGEEENPMPTERFKVEVIQGEEVNIRNVGGVYLGTVVGKLKRGQVAYGTITAGSPSGEYWSLYVEEGSDVRGWVYGKHNWNPTFAKIQSMEEPPLPQENSLSIVLTDDKTGEKWVGKLSKI